MSTATAAYPPESPACQMVDIPVVARAERLIEQADHIAQLEAKKRAALKARGEAV